MALRERLQGTELGSTHSKGRALTIADMDRLLEEIRQSEPSAVSWICPRDYGADPRYPNLVPALTPEYYQQAEIDRRVFWQQPLPVALAALEKMRPSAARWYLLGWENNA